MPKVTEEHRTARRQQIVDAARRCVAEQGFHKTTMADVIRDSGLSAGAVYGYFRSKDELVAAIADDALGAAEELFTRMLAQPDRLSLVDVMRDALEYVVRIAERPGGDVTRVALQAWAEALHNETIRATASGKYRQLRGYLADVVRRAQAEGSIRADVSAEHVAQVMFGLIPGFMLQRLVIGDVTPESYADGLAAMLHAPAPTPDGAA